MFSRAGSDGVECRFGGEHAVTTARLRVVAARYGELLLSRELSRDAEAQYWLGSGPDDYTPRVLAIDPLLLTPTASCLLGLEPSTRRPVAAITLRRAPDGILDIGGVVDPALRARGLGREALEAACRMAHRHFGIVRLRAGCETTNVASQRWLTSCGFTRTEGPPHHVLPNGRTIDSLWWHHVDPQARPRCRQTHVRADAPSDHAPSARSRRRAV